MKNVIVPLILAGTFLTSPSLAYYPLDILPKEAFTFDYNVRMIRMSKTKEDKVLKALDLIRYILSTDEFYLGVINHTYDGQGSFVSNKGLTNRQIYQKILSGAEMLHPFENNTMDLEVELYTENDSTTVGYTWTDSFRIFMNTKYFNKRSAGQITGTIVHEWLHKIGFGHEAETSPDRKFSVPYAIGRIVRELAEKAESEGL